MNLIKVTSKQRNGKAFAKDLLIDLNRITEPAFENSSNETVITLNETPSLKDVVNQGSNNVQYILNETLAAFVALSPANMFIGNVLKREGRKPVISQSVFFDRKIVGRIVEDPLGTKFLYQEKGGTTPIEYIISETIAAIQALLGTITVDPLAPLIYKTLLSQNVPIASKTSGTVLVGQLWTITTFIAGDDFSNWNLISGTGNTTGDVYQATTTTPIVWANLSDLTYDGTPYIVSTDSSGNLNPVVNTLGSPTFTRDGAGVFQAVFTGLLSSNDKFFVDFSPTSFSSSVTWFWNDINSFEIDSLNNAGASSDGILWNTPMTIYVYP